MVNDINDMQKFLQERNHALAVLDMDWARRMMPTASNNHVLLLSMHMARYECIDIAAEQRHQSGDWLRQHGYSRMYGLALLPEGELPIYTYPTKKHGPTDKTI